MRPFANVKTLVVTLAMLVLGLALADHTFPEVRRMLQRLDQAMYYSGYVPTQTHTLRYLAEGYQVDFRAYFKRGTPYAIAGVCDSDCDDLDIQVLDLYGNVVAEDLEPDDTPTVTLNIYRTGWLTVRVLMESCYARTCAFGLGVYGR